MGISEYEFVMASVVDLATGEVLADAESMLLRARKDAYRDLICRYDARMAMRKFSPTPAP